jgi:hypothetical protein
MAVFDATTPSRILPNITKDPYFVKLVVSINGLDLQLITDKTLQEPLLHALLSLYKLKNTIKDKTSTPQTAHTHTDIISFVDEFWPDILLVEPSLVSDSLDKSDSGGGHWDGVWGFTFCDVDAVPCAEV